MPRSFFLGAVLALALALAAIGCGGGDAPAPADGVADRIEAATLEPHLDALQRIADEHGGNRAAGTAGERATASYIAERLRTAGFRVTVEDVPVPVFRERSHPRLTAAGRPYTARTFRYSGGGTVTGVARASGLGCTARAFSGLRRGEIALVRRGTCPFRQKALTAQRAGAAAVIVAARGLVQGALERGGVRIPVVAVGANGAGLDDRRLRLRVDATTTTRNSPNVIGELGAPQAGRVVMAGGHLDSVPAGPGLNDNGSGIAALLAIAAQLGGSQVPEGTALRLGFWGAEEIGLVGSRAYVDGLAPAERRRVAAYINLDMVGSPGAEPAVYDGDATIEAALRRSLGADAPSEDLGGASDHAAFAAAGIPVGGVYTGLDDCYHQQCDAVANVDRAVLTRSAQAAGAALVEPPVAQAEHPSGSRHMGGSVDMRIGLVLHPHRDDTAIMQTLLGWVASHGGRVFVREDDARRCPAGVEGVPDADFAGRVDALISLGGDGTMLGALRLVARRPVPVPVLGVNLGNLGFLVEIHPEELPAALDRLESEQYTVEEHSALLVSGVGEEAVGFNDIAIVRIPGERSVQAALSVGGQRMGRYRSDGLVFSTPIGSTAYAYAAGGPVVSPNLDALIVAPLAPMAGISRPMVVSAAEPVRLELLPDSGRAAIEVDGMKVCETGPGDTLDLQLSPAAGQVVRLDSDRFQRRNQVKLSLLDLPFLPEELRELAAVPPS